MLTCLIRGLIMLAILFRSMGRPSRQLFSLDGHHSGVEDIPRGAGLLFVGPILPASRALPPSQEIASSAQDSRVG